MAYGQPIYVPNTDAQMFQQIMQNILAMTLQKQKIGAASDLLEREMQWKAALANQETTDKLLDEGYEPLGPSMPEEKVGIGAGSKKAVVSKDKPDNVVYRAKQYWKKPAIKFVDVPGSNQKIMIRGDETKVVQGKPDETPKTAIAHFLKKNPDADPKEIAAFLKTIDTPTEPKTLAEAWLKANPKATPGEILAAAEKFKTSMNFYLGAEKLNLSKEVTISNLKTELQQGGVETYSAKGSQYNKMNTRNEVAYMPPPKNATLFGIKFPYGGKDVKFAKLSKKAIEGGWTPERVQLWAEKNEMTPLEVMIQYDLSAEVKPE